MTNNSTTTNQHYKKKYSYSGSDFTIWAMYNSDYADINRYLDYEPGEEGSTSKEQRDKALASDILNSSGIINLGTLQAVTTSYASSLSAVEVIGSSMPVGYTRGQKTYAGSLVFTVMDREPLRELLAHGLARGDDGYDAYSPYISFDQMPPFNIIIEGNSELPDVRGVPQTLRKVIVGVRFMSGGETISVDDFFLEQQHQYVANYITPWIKVAHVTSGEPSAPASELDKFIKDYLASARSKHEF